MWMISQPVLSLIIRAILLPASWGSTDRDKRTLGKYGTGLPASQGYLSKGPLRGLRHRQTSQGCLDPVSKSHALIPQPYLFVIISEIAEHIMISQFWH